MSQQFSNRLSYEQGFNQADTYSPALPRLKASAGQRRLWFLQQLDPGAVTYTESLTFRLRGSLNLDRLRVAVSSIFSRHDVFRTSLFHAEGEVWQQVTPATNLELTSVPAASVVEALSLAEAELQIPFDLARPPHLRATLFRVREDDAILLLAIPHATCDGHSLEIIMKELGAEYSLGDRLATTLSPAVQFSDYSRWHDGWLSTGKAADQRAAWAQRMQDAPLPVRLSGSRNLTANSASQGSVISFDINGTLRQQIQSAASNAGTSLFVYMLAAFHVVLNRYTMQEDLVVGVPVAARSCPAFDDVVGFIANTVPIRCSILAEATFSKVLDLVSTEVFFALENQDVPLDVIVEDARVQRQGIRNPLFDAMFVMQQLASEPTLQMDGLEIDVCKVHTSTAKFDVTMTVEARGERLWGELEYHSSLQDGGWAEDFVQSFLSVLEYVTLIPNALISTIPLLTPQRQLQIAHEVNRIGSWRSPDETLIALFEEVATYNPDTVAVDAGDQIFSYGDLNRRACSVAAGLQDLGVERGTTVALLMDRSIDLIVTVLALMKLGAAYVPLDKRYPTERSKAICADAGALLVVADNSDVAGLSSIGIKATSLSQLPADATPASSRGAPRKDDIAYIYYTSGSTGSPKGVVIDHECALTRLLWLRQRYPLSKGEAVLFKCPLVFDVAVWEIFLPLISGATVIIAEPQLEGDPVYISRLIDDKNVALVHFVPSLLDVFIDVVPPKPYPSLRWVAVSGEALPGDLPQKFNKHFSCELHNQYGQTETSEVALWVADGLGRTSSVPIGQQVGAYRLFVLDPVGNIVPHGAVGELCVAGEGGLARGYRNQAELTEARFVTHPFPIYPNERLYRTGDLARRWSDGVIEYLGRADQQVKLRGCRVELGEVESIVRQHPGIHLCVANVLSDTVCGQFMVAYFTGDVSREELAEHAARSLPIFMRPSAYVKQDDLPRTASGKIDRAALPLPTADDFIRRKDDVPLRTIVEEQVADIWGNLLKVNVTTAGADFFALGGTSLKAVYALRSLSDLYGIHLTTRSIFENRTVCDFARFIEESLERYVADLTDDQVAALLEKER